MPRSTVGTSSNLDPLTLFTAPPASSPSNANKGAGMSSGIFDNFVPRNPGSVVDNRGGTGIPAPPTPAGNVPWTPAINPGYTNNIFQGPATSSQDAAMAADRAFRQRFGMPAIENAHPGPSPFTPNRTANVVDTRTGGLPLTALPNNTPQPFMTPGLQNSTPPASTMTTNIPDYSQFLNNLLNTYQGQAGQANQAFLNALSGLQGSPYSSGMGTPSEWLASLGGQLGGLQQFVNSGGSPTPGVSGYINQFLSNGNPSNITMQLQQYLQNGGDPTKINSFLQQFTQNGLPSQLSNPYLQRFAQSAMPVDALPAWQTYVDSMQRNNQQGAAQLMEMFNSRGGYQSTSFGNAAVDYQTQIQKDQNALLAQMGYSSLTDALNRQMTAGSTLDQLSAQFLESAKQRQYGASGALDALNAQLAEAAKGRQFTAAGSIDQLNASLAEAAKGRQFSAASLAEQQTLAAQEAAKSRQFNAASQLGQMAYGGASQLAGYDFNSQMAQYNASLQAAMMLGQQAYGATQQLGQYGNSAANQLLQNAIGGTSALFGGSQNALNSLFGNQSNLLNQLISSAGNTYNSQLGSAGNLAGLFQQYAGLGGQLGQQQYTNLQSQLGSLYQEWLRTQPQYNPLLPYMFQGATGYVPTNQTTSPGFWDYFSQILGAGIGAAGTVAGAAISDVRLKENIIPIGSLRDVNLYEYNLKGLPGKQVGVLAQEVIQTHPRAVIPGDNAKPWMVNYKQLTDELMLSGRAA